MTTGSGAVYSNGSDTMSGRSDTEYVQTIVIGGGQAGLAVGYHLARRGLPFLILDAHPRVGDAWRKRWDSLRLFSPARYDALPGMKFPAPAGAYPSKDQMADYLEAYARRWGLPVRTGVRVDGLTREGERFVVTAGPRRFEADEVVVAMANYQRPRVPPFAKALDPGIVQIHAHDYRNPGQLREGGVLVVGVGNSGADIAMEVGRTHQTLLSGKESGVMPFQLENPFYRHGMVRVMRFIGHRVLNVRTPIGRKVRPKLLHGAAPLIRVKPRDLVAAGIERVAKVEGARDGRPLLADGRVLDVTNVIWCTGFDPGFSWIRLPVFEDGGDPVHRSGVVPGMLGLYFVGLQFLHAMTSATVNGVGRDAERIVEVIRARVAERLRQGADTRLPVSRLRGGSATAPSAAASR
jgi:putative flavoprotein involved in K+ transport